MRNMAVTTFMAVGLLAAAALAQQQPGRSLSSASSARSSGAQHTTFERAGWRAAPASVTFADADANDDGKLTRREARVVPFLSFGSADADQDSALSREEFDVALANARPRG